MGVINSNIEKRESRGALSVLKAQFLSKIEKCELWHSRHLRGKFSGEELEKAKSWLLDFKKLIDNVKTVIVTYLVTRKDDQASSIAISQSSRTSSVLVSMT